MNKKIFAALASATMALSATGSLAVFAEDFDVVTEANGNNGTGAGEIIANNNVVINSENFPDDGFRDFILNWTGLDYGDKIDVNALKAVTELNVIYDADESKWSEPEVSYKPAAPLKSITVTGAFNIKDLTGIEFFPNLTTLYVGGARGTKADGSPQVIRTNPGFTKLVTANLSDNEKLETITIVGADSLENLTVPTGNTLHKLHVCATEYKDAANPGAIAPLTLLDLSTNKQLADVRINNTLVAKLDLSNNPYLVYANLDNNDINTLDITNCGGLQQLSVNNNSLYNLDLPKNAQLQILNAENNMLQEIDLTGQAALTGLVLNNNELKSLDLSDCKQLNILQVKYNHLGMLDASMVKYPGNNGYLSAEFSPQVVYVDSAYNAINLPETFDGFKLNKVAEQKNFNDETGVLTLDDDGQATYAYNTGFSVNEPDFDPNMYVAVVTGSVLNRLYNPNSGEHFYTSDIEEKDTLVDLGWHDEGVAWVSPTESTQPVYRLYNPNAGDHHYTKNAYERDTLVNVGWKYEGIGWYSYTGGETYADLAYTDPDTSATTPYTINSVNVLREYNPNAKAAGAHNYTMNPAENDFLVSVGWLDEGIAWQAMK